MGQSKVDWIYSGSGYVKAVGSKVTVAQPGDPVLLSFNFCGSCAICKRGYVSHCTTFNELNFVGENDYTLSSRTSSKEKPDIGGGFFGQSSFSSLSIVRENSVCNVKNVVKDKEELQLFAPLGCGIQTGSGTVINVAEATKDDVIVVMGLGGVGLSAIMAAKIQECKMIIGVDLVESRLKLAKDFGATHTVNGKALPGGKSIGDVIKEIAEDVGPSITIDTTGVPSLIKAGLEFTRNRGKYLQVGTAPMDATIEIPIFLHMVAGKQFIGAVEGGAVPSQYVPKMIKWYRDGKFPVDKLVQFMKADEFERGLKEMHDGQTIKPILLW